MKWYLKAANPFRLVYDGENTTGSGATNTGGAGSGAEDPPPPTNVPTNPDGTGDKTGETSGTKSKKISQEKMNALLAEEKRKHQQVINKQVKELEKLQRSTNLNEQAKSELQGRIEELQNTLLTKEELAAKDTKRLQEEAKKERETLSGERDTWKNRFMQSTTHRALLDEALKADAFNPNTVVALLAPNTRLTEVLDAQGNPIPDNFIPKIKFQDLDKDGKPVTLDLTVPEALKRMRDQPDLYGNLFKSGVSGGLGATNRQAPNQKDPAKMTHEEWLKHRETIGLARKKSGFR